jgi:hypothetical protein
MSQADEREPGSQSKSAGTPVHMQWDTSKMDSRHCDLATASVTRKDIVLNFGALVSRGRQPEKGVELLGKIALSPIAAQNLAATLRKLLDEYDARSR